MYLLAGLGARRFRLGQLVWWGEFIARVTAISPTGTVLSLQGGPVLGDGAFDPLKLRPLGIGGSIRVAFDSIINSKRVPLQLRLLVFHDCCGQCGRWVEGLGRLCPRCGDIRSWKSGWSLYGMWIHFYMKLWFSRNKTISAFGRWLWCNEFKGF